MSCVGIVVNPFSGKDLRRITASALNVSNMDKADKVIRMINSMRRLEVDKVLLLPDNYSINHYISSASNKQEGRLSVEVLDFRPQDNFEDTLLGLRMMAERNISCLIILGGDGTCRLAAKAHLDVPLIPVSTGTNNVYPEFWEGTTVGIAAAFAAAYGAGATCCNRSKQISVYVNGALTEVALVDAAVTKTPYIGSRIIPDISDITDLVVCKCSPELIGLSALVGCIVICDDEDEFGFGMGIGEGEKTVLASVNPGELIAVRHKEPQRMQFGERWRINPPFHGTIALDGERTLPFRRGDRIEFVIERNGPLKMDLRKTLRSAVKLGFMDIPADSAEGSAL